MSIKKSILLMCDSLQRYRFMERLASSVDDYSLIFITSEPLVYLSAISKGYKCVFLKATRKQPDEDVQYEEIANKSIEVINGYCSIVDAKNDICCSLLTLESRIDIENVSFIFIWNGQQILGRILTEFALIHKLKKSYLEISNLPSKLFSDPKGVNALSSIASCKEKIALLEPVSEVLHNEWLNYYYIEKNKPLPQSINSLNNKIQSVTNRIMKFCVKGIGQRKINLSEFIFSTKGIVYPENAFTEIKTDEEFIFLPLQVTSDTQLKLHSKVNNIDAIKIASKKAKEVGLSLVIKIHPAERSQQEINTILSMKDELGFFISDKNTNLLIKSSSFVITINSTVGIEAMLQKKHVDVLGEAFYKNFNHEDLKKYIHHYLISDIDFFSFDIINKSSVNRIIENANY